MVKAKVAKSKKAAGGGRDEKEDIIIVRVNQGKCPVCNKEIIEGDEIEFVDYKGTKQPVHKWHINK